MSSLRRPVTLVAAGGMLVAAALFVWQRGGAPVHAGFTDPGAFRAAYARVSLGMSAQHLARLGFDRTRPGAHTLSYLGTMEFFMPRSSRDYDRLDPAIQSCLAVADRCGAYVFRLNGEARSDALFDFAAHAAPRDEARAVFLVMRGRVAYKQMAGE